MTPNSSSMSRPAIPPALREAASRWRREAADLRTRYGDERLARLCEVHANELELAARAAAEERLTLEEASRESGYSHSHLRAMLASGDLPNAGRKHRPRVLRGDLPSKSAAKRPARRSGASSGEARVSFGRRDPAAAARRAVRADLS